MNAASNANENTFGVNKKVDKRQRKRDKRKKKRQKHLQKHKHKLRRQLEQQAIIPFISHKPDNDDREGWDAHNKINKNSIISKAKQLYHDNPILRRFLTGQITHTDTDLHLKIGKLLTSSAQKIYNNPPYFIPFVTIHPYKKGRCVVAELMHLRLTKHRTSLGNLWTIPNIKFSIAGRQVYFTSHAMERLYERMVPDDGFSSYVIITILHAMQVKDLPRSNLIMLYCTRFDEDNPIGYCPVDIVDNKAVLTSFLLPCMKGTPEFKKLGEEFEISSYKDLLLHKNILDKYNIPIFHHPCYGDED